MPPKKAYSKPALVVYGDLTRITQSAGITGGLDGGCGEHEQDRVARCPAMRSQPAMCVPSPPRFFGLRLQANQPLPPTATSRPSRLLMSRIHLSPSTDRAV